MIRAVRPSRPRKRYRFRPVASIGATQLWQVGLQGGRGKNRRSTGTLAGADTVNLPRAKRIACPRSARSPTDLSGIPVSDITRAIEWRGYPDNGSFRGGNGGKKNDLWWSYLFYIYIVCFFLARSIRVLELEFIPRWAWNDSNRINRICM